MSLYEDSQSGGGGGETKSGKAAIAERKKRRREGKQKDKHTSSMVVACLKRLLPVGLNVFGGRELDIVQQSKEKFLQVYSNIDASVEPLYISLLLAKFFLSYKKNEGFLFNFYTVLLTATFF